ncbi:MAG: helix-turn-helix transcriptional regulator, partial [Actinocatenispora sp.]
MLPDGLATSKREETAVYPITFGAELRRRRKAGGYTLRSFATLAHVSYAHLSKLETGKQPPTPEVARVVDAALDADGALVALAAEGRAARVRGAASGDSHGRGAEDMHRRMLLNAAATLAVGVAGLAGIDIDPTTRRRIGLSDVDRIEAALSRMWAIDHERGAGDLWDIAVARAQSLSVAMDLCDYDEATGRRLLTVTGHAYVGAGWFALDAGRDDIARPCYNEALSLARQAGDSTLTAHTLANLALQALFLSQPRQAMRYVDAAEHVTTASVPARQVAVLKMRRGRALAQLGEATESGRQLTAARRMLGAEDGEVPERLAYFT